MSYEWEIWTANFKKPVCCSDVSNWIDSCGLFLFSLHLSMEKIKKTKYWEYWNSFQDFFSSIDTGLIRTLSVSYRLLRVSAFCYVRCQSSVLVSCPLAVILLATTCTMFFLYKTVLIFRIIKAYSEFWRGYTEVCKLFFPSFLCFKI